MRKLSRLAPPYGPKLKPMENVPNEDYPFCVAVFARGGNPEPLPTMWADLESACVAAYDYMIDNKPQSAVVTNLKTGDIWGSDWIVSHVKFSLDLISLTMNNKKAAH